MTMHLDEAQLNDLVDGSLAPDERRSAEAHVATCAACAEAMERLRTLHTRLRALPRDIPPPQHVADAVRDRIAAELSAGPTVAAPARPATSRFALLAAAAVVLVAVSSGVTALLLRTTPGDAPPPAAAANGNGAARLTGMHAIERTYQAEIVELQRILASEGTVLAPETLRIIEANLGIIDRALAEAREALADDPANESLAELLRSGYERKLDVLRSAAAYTRGRS